MLVHASIDVDDTLKNIGKFTLYKISYKLIKIPSQSVQPFRRSAETNRHID